MSAGIDSIFFFYVHALLHTSHAYKTYLLSSMLVVPADAARRSNITNYGLRQVMHEGDFDTPGGGKEGERGGGGEERERRGEGGRDEGRGGREEGRGGRRGGGRGKWERGEEVA